MLATCPYPEPDQESPCLPSTFLKIHHNIILPSMPGSSKWSLSLGFPTKTPYTSLLPIRTTCPAHLIPSVIICLFNETCCYTGRCVYRKIWQSNAKLVLKLSSVLIHFWLQVRLQTQSFRNPQYKGAINCFTSILKKESVRTFLYSCTDSMLDSLQDTWNATSVEI